MINVSEYFNNHKKYKEISMEAITLFGPKVTYIYAPFGLEPSDFNPSGKVYKWVTAKQEQNIPDFIFIDFGMWFMTIIPVFYNDASDIAYTGMRYALRRLTTLKKKVTLVVMAKSRSRLLTSRYYKNNNINGYSSNPWSFHQWNIGFQERLTPAYSDLLDMIALTASENFDVIYWDSTVPFNLASNEECEELVETNHAYILNEYKQNKPIARLMCHDTIHKSASTLQDEFTMILNMLCNNFLPDEKQHFCCV